MEIDVVEGLGERLFAHSPGLQHLDAILVAQDARLPGAGAQGVGYLGRPPMGMHVDHGCHGYFLYGPSRSLTPPRRAGKYDNRHDRSMAPTLPWRPPAPSRRIFADHDRGRVGVAARNLRHMIDLNV